MRHRAGDYMLGKVKGSVIDFTRYFFVQRYGFKFKVARHHREIAGMLDRVISGDVKRLIINIAPRYGKTELAVMNFIAYGMAINPASNFLHISYSEDLVRKNCKGVRDIMTCDAYKHLFGNSAIERQTAQEITTIKKGNLYCTTTGGQITGFGAGLQDTETEGGKKFGGAVVIDDPLKPSDALSRLQREKANDNFESTIRNRVNSKDTPIVIIMQRLHEHDLCGYLIEKEGRREEGGVWDVLSMPCLYHDEEGVRRALWEEKHSVEDLLLLKNINNWIYETQYQQNAQPIEGLLFPESFTKYYEGLPDEPEHKFMIVDPADKGSNKTCAAVYYLHNGLVYVPEVLYSVKESEYTIPLILDMIVRHGVTVCVVESNSAWALYRKDLKRQAAEMGLDTEIRSVLSKEGKEVRIFNSSPVVKNRFLYRPPAMQDTQYQLYMDDKHSYLKMVMNQNDDGVDTDNLAVEYLKREGLIN